MDVANPRTLGEIRQQEVATSCRGNKNWKTWNYGCNRHKVKVYIAKNFIIKYHLNRQRSLGGHYLKDLYDMIFKRKSFRRFNGTLALSQDELKDIYQKLENLNPLVNEMEIKYKIVQREQTTSKRGEYSLLIYSEEKNIIY